MVASNATGLTATIQATDKNGVAIDDETVIDTMTWDANTIANFEVKNVEANTWGNLSSTDLKAGKATLVLRTKATMGGVTQTLKATNGANEAKANVALVDQVATKVGISTE